jgi:hypothetical protein
MINYREKRILGVLIGLGSDHKKAKATPGKACQTRQEEFPSLSARKEENNTY